MATKMNVGKLLIGCSAFFLTGCGYADIDGMFVSTETVNERFEQSISYNEQNGVKAIQAESESYHVDVVGDVHVGGTVNFDQFLSFTKSEKATAVVLDGDICSGNRADYDTLETHLKANRGNLNCFLIVGNHDLYFGGWKQFYARFGSSSYYFTVQTPSGASDLFICLDSGGGTLGSKQLSWLKNVLSKRAEYRKCVIFTHNNLYRIRRTGSTNPLMEELTVLTDLFARYRVDMVVTGHDHVRNVLTLGNTIHVTMDALLDGYLTASYFKLSINDGVISYQFVEL